MNDPYSPTPFFHYVLAYKLLSNSSLSILDYGCGTGNFIGNLRKRSKRIYGWDVDPRKIEIARLAYPNVKFKLGKVNDPLPYADNSLDVVTLFHVLEHVDSESRVVNEVHRVLKKNGLFILASPYRGLFTFADAANIRFRFPQLHKWVVETFLGKKEYSNRFERTKLLGMHGDCTSSRHWHHHYTEEELRILIGSKLNILKIYKFSLFYPFLLIPYNIINYFFKPKVNPFVWLIHLDNLVKARNLSYNFLLIATKQ